MLNSSGYKKMECEGDKFGCRWLLMVVGDYL